MTRIKFGNPVTLKSESILPALISLTTVTSLLHLTLAWQILHSDVNICG
jgi:hypothetical protein